MAYSLDAFNRENTERLERDGLGKTSIKKNCIFYDIVLKGRGVKDQNLISRNI